MEENTDEIPGARTRMRDLWRDFEAWCEQNGEQAVLKTYSSQKFHQEMDSRWPHFERGGIRNGQPLKNGIQLKIRSDT